MIDKKGKLFGIINVVDLTVLIIIISLVGAVGYKLYSNKGQGLGIGAETKIKEITVHVKARLKSEETAKSLKIGDVLVAKNTYTGAVIESVSYTDGDYTVATEDGKLNLTTHPLWKDIDIVVKGTADVSGPIITIGGQEIRVGRPFWVKTQTVEVLGEIVSIEIK